MSYETKIAIPILQKNKEDILKIAEDYIKKGADLLELRIDSIANSNPKMVKSIIEEINFPTIATNRSPLEGGYFKGNEKDRIAILQNCVDIAEFIDIELQTELKYITPIIDSGVKTIISFHDFEKTPPIDDLMQIIEEEKNIGDIAKIAVMPKDLEDTIIVLAILSRYENTIAISMGEIGSYTRVMASKFNSPITFATGGDVTAPGQIDIETMKLMLNMNIIDHDELVNTI
ncbi:3-dehydroquinate dehydratase [Methanobrevibacter cuticularis]|uniref:3-dehydroquinate dehydratase n=1 Tax=Methanobrevibacter cuticularis TaxID=47311 RepID=A0A166CUI3_9EURY|nr:type I 3-dehydroquinate dehydratase [Methanobrevibacter cuticularis]KZX14878.1 3-dehydroquinate dehydratase [Methanobrevibacter cuticularis]